MRITVNLDTQAVITQPSPARVKAGGIVSMEVGFTRASQTAMLPAGASVEFALKPKNVWTGGMLVYHSAFAAGSGNAYRGEVNFATQPLLASLGLADNAPSNDIGQIEVSCEIAWNIGNMRFRSITFPITVESPITDAIIVPPADPALYPTPGELQTLLDAKAAASAPGFYRLDAMGGLQLFNPDTGFWHSLVVRGQPGQETLEISAAISP